ncbi:MAG: hypothetical protein HQK91_05890 [Nitrospirae bacterium]|nr:hypothetical protein [Nitrospirota bacterium]
MPIDCITDKNQLEVWLNKKGRLKEPVYDPNCNRPPLDNETILRDNKRFKPTNKNYDSRMIYQEKETDYYWYVDNLHNSIRSAHLEVFNRFGKHIGEADLNGFQIANTKDNQKIIKI